ncbi:glycosyl transferase group 1 [Rhodomicrobium vannielii ATCC 17100]|uniref:Glycosyl transferase group 1 n=1 Tax=Rhodomicrobium vannielii (strain ATCC 17100 / DSM 162 / LMG 4299 / NCIMB 10020 / ATH 3.1.1) TaxID=648757 RepID=E3I5G0_RHOVT|nr:glycosyltransferase family 1 protein [Rhodomicrobium vannielii]ADP71681.1 glycosyl transferase group 1 [Rhodomicrobium vannielii ATCC 17100]
MNVVIDGFNLALEKGTGVATYARNLSRCLHGIGHSVHILYGKGGATGKTEVEREIAFFDENPIDGEGRLGRARRVVSTLVSPFPRRPQPITLSGTVIYQQVASKLPFFDCLWNSPHLYSSSAAFFKVHRRRLAVRIPNVEIAHWTYPLPVKLQGAINIYTFHDLVPLRLPYTTLDRKREYHRLITHLARKSDHIITVSETSRQDIINIIGVPEERVTNTYQSVDIPSVYLCSPQNIVTDELKGAFNLNYKEYILYYGSIEPKKNVGRIVEAYLASNVPVPLVIVGAQAWKSDQELKLLKNSTQSGSIRRGARRIVVLEYVAFPQLVNLVRGALAITFPSLYEGFGLPIIEGMVCGTPVITSNVGSMAEIAGDGAILVDPYDTRDIKNAIVEVVASQELRADKVARGAVVARQFSAEAYQKRLEQLYARLKPSIGRPLQTQLVKPTPERLNPRIEAGPS